MILRATAVFALSQVTFIVYYYVANYTTVPQQYKDNLIRKCPGAISAKIFHEAAFPYIGKTALGYFAYIGVLVKHRYFTSNATNETEIWKSLVRLVLTYIIVWVFLKQLELVDWT